MKASVLVCDLKRHKMSGMIYTVSLVAYMIRLMEYLEYKWSINELQCEGALVSLVGLFGTVLFGVSLLNHKVDD